MNHCRIIEIKRAFADSAAEPVTLAEAKAWMKITFSDEDSIVTELITACRQQVEEYCNISLIERDVVAIAELNPPNDRSRIEFRFPYGPLVQGEPIVVSKMKCDGSGYDVMVLDTDYYIIGDVDAILVVNTPGIYKVEYATGFDAIPALIKQGIKTEVANWYENRGDVSGNGMSEMTKRKVQPYKQMTWQ